MEKLIDLFRYPVKNVLKNLLVDKTTGKNIIFATNAYSEYNVDEKTEITSRLLFDLEEKEIIIPRFFKNKAKQDERTRRRAEVFTPAWICNKMNNHCDEEWFKRKNVFNTETDQTWITSPSPIKFTQKNDWKKYVLSKRLEITCGEAPYLVSRYDSSTGIPIPIKDRIGILDRKLRIISENTNSEKTWKHWVNEAYKSIYGYEFQGDNLLIARVNLLVTFVDYMYEKFKRVPTQRELMNITNIIIWNIWQMDGMTCGVPYCKPVIDNSLLKFWESIQGINEIETEQIDCKIYDWEKKEEITYKSIRDGNRHEI